MDIIAKSILNFVQKQTGYNNSVIAGGAVRDNLFGIAPKDYDICVPSPNRKSVEELINRIKEEFGISDLVLKSKAYENAIINGQKISSVFGFTFENRKFDLIGHYESDDENFAERVIEKFDFGINMVYYDGNSVVMDNDKFSRDWDFHTMSLYNLNDISKLPTAVIRYLTLNDRVGGFLQFHAPCLELKSDKLSKKMKVFSGSYAGTTNTVEGFFNEAPTINDILNITTPLVLNIPNDGVETDGAGMPAAPAGF